MAVATAKNAFACSDGVGKGRTAVAASRRAEGSTPVRSRPLVGAILLATTFAFVGLLAGPAGASPSTLWVSLAPVGSNTGCSSPGFNTIQGAVSAAGPGNTVQVCAGIYTEQVTITTHISLHGAGAGSTRIQMPLPAADSLCNPGAPNPPGPPLHSVDVIDVCTGSGGTTKISGLTVAGPYGSLDCTLQGYGIAVVDNSAANISNTTVTDIREDPLNGCQGGVGILVGRLSTDQVGKATLKNVTVSDYQKGGIVVSNTGSSAKISKSTVAGVGETDQIAQNGIQISYGASGSVTNSTIVGNECNVGPLTCGPDPETQTQSAGVLLYDAGPKTKVQNSIISGNDMGVYNYESPDDTPPGSPVKVSTNHLSNNRYEGFELDGGTMTASSNTITGGNAGVDILLYAGQSPAVSGTVKANTITYAGDAIRVSSDGDPGDTAPTVNLSGNLLDTTNSAGASNPTNFVINVKNSWWGNGTGPSGWALGTGSSTSANVDFFPWATNPSLTALAGCTVTGNNITGSVPADAILCGTGGNDYIDVSDGPVLILGNGGNDQLRGTTSADAIIGGPGNDFIDGRGGNDFIQCRGGTDSVVPHPGDSLSNC